MTRQLRWGILGAAHIAARRLLPAFAHARTGTVTGIASRDVRRARDVAAQFGIPRVHESYDALLADPEIDAIYNPLPNSHHRPWTERAASAGKHVLCEKPLAVTAADAQAMVDACRRAGVLLQEAFMYRFHPQIERLQVLIADGAIGRCWLVRTTFTFTAKSADDIRLDAALGGGGLLDVGCYCVSIGRLLLGEPRRAFASAVYERDVDVRLAGALGYEDGRAALVDCGLRAPQRQWCEAVGPEGTIIVPRPFQPEQEPAEIILRRRDQEERIVIPGTNQYTLMVDHFGACVLDGVPPRFPAEDAVANMHVLDALQQSARTGGQVTLEPGR